MKLCLFLLQMGLFLHPRFKTLSGLDDAQKDTCMGHIDIEVETHDPIEQPAAKRMRISKYHEFEDASSSEQDPRSSEIEMYRSMSFDANLSVHEFWRQHERDLPKLALLARRVLCITPSSAPSERAFSLAGHVCSSRRTSLKQGSVNNILMLNSHLKYN